MTETNKLTELLEQTGMLESKTRCAIAAAELAAAGVKAPPCNIGDRVYTVGVFSGQVVSCEVVAIIYAKNGCFLHLENETVVFVEEQLGKTVFLSEAEAVRGLKELRNNG